MYIYIFNLFYLLNVLLIISPYAIESEASDIKFNNFTGSGLPLSFLANTGEICK